MSAEPLIASTGTQLKPVLIGLGTLLGIFNFTLACVEIASDKDSPESSHLYTVGLWASLGSLATGMIADAYDGIDDRNFCSSFGMIVLSLGFLPLGKTTQLMWSFSISAWLQLSHEDKDLWNCLLCLWSFFFLGFLATAIISAMLHQPFFSERTFWVLSACGPLAMLPFYVEALRRGVPQKFGNDGIVLSTVGTCLLAAVGGLIAHLFYSNVVAFWTASIIVTPLEAFFFCWFFPMGVEYDPDSPVIPRTRLASYIFHGQASSLVAVMIVLLVVQYLPHHTLVQPQLLCALALAFEVWVYVDVWKQWTVQVGLGIRSCLSSLRAWLVSSLHRLRAWVRVMVALLVVLGIMFLIAHFLPPVAASVRTGACTEDNASGCRRCHNETQCAVCNDGWYLAGLLCQKLPKGLPNQQTVSAGITVVAGAATAAAAVAASGSAATAAAASSGTAAAASGTAVTTGSSAPLLGGGDTTGSGAAGSGGAGHAEAGVAAHPGATPAAHLQFKFAKKASIAGQWCVEDVKDEDEIKMLLVKDVDALSQKLVSFLISIVMACPSPGATKAIQIGCPESKYCGLQTVLSPGSTKKYKPIILEKCSDEKVGEKSLDETASCPTWSEKDAPDGAMLVLTGKHQAEFYTWKGTYRLMRRVGLLGQLSKVVMPSLFIAFAYMASTIGATSIAYVNAGMALLQWSTEAMGGNADFLKRITAWLKHVKWLAPIAEMIPLLGTSVVLAAVGWTNMLLEHQSHPDYGWLSLVFHQHTYFLGALLLPAFFRLTKFGESEDGQAFLLDDEKVTQYAKWLALLCFALTTGAVVTLVVLTHGAIIGQSKTMLSIACGGWAGILNTMKSNLQSHLSDINFAATTDIEKNSEPVRDKAKGKSQWGEYLSMSLPSLSVVFRPCGIDLAVPLRKARDEEEEGEEQWGTLGPIGFIVRCHRRREVKIQVQDQTTDQVCPAQATVPQSQTPPSIMDRLQANSAGKSEQKGSISISLSWNQAPGAHDRNDLDLWVTPPSGEKIWYSEPKSKCGGCLDVDRQSDDDNPVENVVWTKDAPSGHYKVEVNNCSTNHDKPVKFEIMIVKDGGAPELFQNTVAGNSGAVVTVVDFQYPS